ncbi:hypothetical protein TNCV_2499231 [Trichonephila clavipes]|nr:hypothetical protein TNCV_2499231 [Trichonephila clavipes]
MHPVLEPPKLMIADTLKVCNFVPTCFKHKDVMAGPMKSARARSQWVVAALERNPRVASECDVNCFCRDNLAPVGVRPRFKRTSPKSSSRAGRQ